MKALATLALVGLLVPSAAFAQDARRPTPRRWSFNLELGAGTMIHDFDHAGVDFGTPAVTTHGRFDLRLVGPLYLQFGGTFGQFVRDRRNIQLVAGTLGLRVSAPLGRRGSLWADADFGVYLPGTVVRPGFDVGVGYAFDLGPNVSLGPVLRVGHVWEGREGFGRYNFPYTALPDQDTSSIQWWTLGISVSFHQPARPARPPRAPAATP